VKKLKGEVKRLR
jgi:serine/threonine protein kinase